MKKLKLGFTDTHDHLAQFFSSVLANRFDVEIDNENPDYLIFGDENFGTNNKKFSKSDCVKIFYTGENRRPENYDCHYAITFDHNFSNWHYRLPLNVIYMWSLDMIHQSGYDYYHILGEHEPKEKTGFCSFVVSNGNCKERNDFFQLLNQYKPVDSGGKLFNNIDANLDGEVSKIDFLSSRKFNIAFESGSYPGYVTEKILHAFYAKTVPIYWGSPTVAADWNPEAFINAHNFDSQQELLDHVMMIDQDDDLYNSIVTAPPLAAGIPKDYMLLNNFLNWFDATVYNKIDMREE
jgi:hypothetical protein